MDAPDEDAASRKARLAALRERAAAKKVEEERPPALGAADLGEVDAPEEDASSRKARLAALRERAAAKKAGLSSEKSEGPSSPAATAPVRAVAEGDPEPPHSGPAARGG